MRIQNLAIHNFRSIRDLDLLCDDLTILLGPNNHGKSNILSALDFALSLGSKPQAKDFFEFREKNDDVLWVEINFVDLTVQESTTFLRYVNEAGELTIRKTAILDGSTVNVSYNGYVSEPTHWWLKSSAFERLSSKGDIEDETVSVPELAPLLAIKGKVTKQALNNFQTTFIDENKHALSFERTLETGPLLGLRSVAAGVLPDFHLVPAIRDLSDEIRIKNTTLFGKLMNRALTEMAEINPKFTEIKAELKQLVDGFNVSSDGAKDRPLQLVQLEGDLTDELRSWGVGVHIQVSPPELEAIFEQGTELNIDDGLKSAADRKGHGLQRAVLFAILRVWARALRHSNAEKSEGPRKASESLIFAIEEPELFLHPHAQRRLFSTLKEIASASEHQILLCTHSTHFVDLSQHQRIAIISKEDPADGSRVRQHPGEFLPLGTHASRKQAFNLATWINPARGELFFAKKVVLVEGATESAVLPFLASKLGCLDTDISIIDCGSKFNLPIYVELLKAFKIPYLVVHDEDPLPVPLPADDEKRASATRVFGMNVELRNAVVDPLGSIFIFKPNFEKFSGVSRTQGEKVGKPLAAINHFSAMSNEALPPEMVKFVKLVYGQEGESVAIGVGGERTR